MELDSRLNPESGHVWTVKIFQRGSAQTEAKHVPAAGHVPAAPPLAPPLVLTASDTPGPIAEAASASSTAWRIGFFLDAEHWLRRFGGREEAHGKGGPLCVLEAELGQEDTATLGPGLPMRLKNVEGHSLQFGGQHTLLLRSADSPLSPPGSSATPTPGSSTAVDGPAKFYLHSSRHQLAFITLACRVTAHAVLRARPYATAVQFCTSKLPFPSAGSAAPRPPPEEAVQMGLTNGGYRAHELLREGGSAVADTTAAATALQNGGAGLLCALARCVHRQNTTVLPALPAAVLGLLLVFLRAPDENTRDEVELEWWRVGGVGLTVDMALYYSEDGLPPSDNSSLLAPVTVPLSASQAPPLLSSAAATAASPPSLLSAQSPSINQKPASAQGPRKGLVNEGPQDMEQERFFGSGTVRRGVAALLHPEETLSDILPQLAAARVLAELTHLLPRTTEGANGGPHDRNLVRGGRGEVEGLVAPGLAPYIPALAIYGYLDKKVLSSGIRDFLMATLTHGLYRLVARDVFKFLNTVARGRDTETHLIIWNEATRADLAVQLAKVSG